LDLEKDHFHLAFSAPENLYDVGFHSFDFNCYGALAAGFLVGKSDGDVVYVDPRVRGRGQENCGRYGATWDVHDTKVNSVQQHPTHEHVVLSCGGNKDGSVVFWDLRVGMGGGDSGGGGTAKRGSGGGSRKDLILSKFHAGDNGPPARKLHDKSINAGYVSPDGSSLVTVSQDSTVKVWQQPECNGTTCLVPPGSKDSVKPSSVASLRHDNHTGRWLSTFHPAFDPKVGGY
jgi:WD40 repeat protein